VFAKALICGVIVQGFLLFIPSNSEFASKFH
jgi:hypothetical protein